MRPASDLPGRIFVLGFVSSLCVRIEKSGMQNAFAPRDAGCS
jgi:hypothetical protein